MNGGFSATNGIWLKKVVVKTANLLAERLVLLSFQFVQLYPFLNERLKRKLTSTH